MDIHFLIFIKLKLHRKIVFLFVIDMKKIASRTVNNMQYC